MYSHRSNNGTYFLGFSGGPPAGLGNFRENEGQREDLSACKLPLEFGGPEVIGDIIGKALSNLNKFLKICNYTIESFV